MFFKLWFTMINNYKTILMGPSKHFKNKNNAENNTLKLTTKKDF